MPYEQKVKLGISHEEDKDLAEDYDHHGVIVNEMLDEMRQNDTGSTDKEKKSKQNSEEDTLFTRR